MISILLTALSVLQEPATRPAEEAASRPASRAASDLWPVELDADRVPRTRTGGNVLVKDATVLPVSGPMLERASVLVRGGKIAAVGSNLTVPEGTVVVDAKGAFLVPGAIDCHSHMAISGPVNEMTDSITAECKIADVLDPDDIAIYRALAGGCTTARLLHGSANVIGGEHAVVKLKFHRTAADLLVTDAPRGIKFALGENPKQSNFRAPGRPLRYPTTRMGVEAVIRRAFDEAKDWLARERNDLDRIARGEWIPPRRRDTRLETIAGILSGDVAIHSHCYRADEILMLLEVAESYGVRVRTLQHVLEGYKVAPEIARHGAGASTFSDWWAYKMEAYDAIPYNVALMTRAGVNVTINSDSDELIRRLHLDSAKAIRYGMLTADECLATCTLNVAKQLGLDHRMGSIEVGKDADLALFDAHPLSVESKCILTIVDGEVEFERRDVWTELAEAVAREAAATLGAPDDRPNVKVAERAPWAPGAPPAPEDLAIVHGTVVPVGSAAFSDGTIVVRRGVITEMGPGLPAPPDCRVLDASGLYVYPGIIDGSASLGLTEVASVSATVDLGEADARQPDLRALRAVHADSAHVPVARANGITTAHVVPAGGLLAGQSALVHLDGWTPAEMRLADPLFLHVEFPAQRADDPDKGAEENDKEREKHYRNSTRELKRWFERAAAYSRSSRELARDPKLEALTPYATGARPVLFSVGSARDAVGAVRFAEENGLHAVLRIGPQDVARIASFLARKRVPVLLTALTVLPRDRNDPYDTCFAAPRILHAAGVRFAFVSADSSNTRNLPFQAGMAVAHGLPMGAALRAVTLGAAEILGVDPWIGSIAVGKVADLILTDGNPLEVRTHVKGMLIGGREVDLDSKHTRLYGRYLERLPPEQRNRAGPPR